MFTLGSPFQCQKWNIVLRISEENYKPECKELLNQMAVDFGAIVLQAGEGHTAEDQQVLQRLKRLEQRFRGSGVTDGEARNAMRLFERELSKANWTEEKFEKLKRQLEGVEEWSASDTVVEASLRWVETGQKRQAWFTDACERVAIPLGLEFGYAQNGGCCFVGPLSAAAGAALTASLVSHLADLDLSCAQKMRKGSKVSPPQFRQGFVDGALEPERHLVWQRLFSIEDAELAADFCRDNLQSGFFNNLSDEGASNVDEGGEDIQAMLRGLFASEPERQPQQMSSSSTSGHRQRHTAHPGGDDFLPEFGAPSSFTPFSGKCQRLDEDGGDAAPTPQGNATQQPKKGSDSWAITFSSNLELARQSRQRSSGVARKTYHWTTGGRAVKATKTDTTSYSQGRDAGNKRKGQIDSAAGTAKRKFNKGVRHAICG